MAAPVGALSAQALAHPAFEPLRPWLRRFDHFPECSDLNALIAGTATPPRSLAGRPIRFSLPEAAGRGHYEEEIFDTGMVRTRPDNLHDLFNALVWIAFPRTKAAINARHVARFRVEGNRRGSLRDLLTLFDEGGVIVACADDACAGIEALVRDFNWQVLFWERRGSLVRDARFVLTGHNAYEKASAPYPGITCKSLFIPTPREKLAAPSPDLVAWLDSEAADWVSALPEDAGPRQMAPLPVFGYPDWLPGSANAGFYQDQRWFRPGPAGKAGRKA
jgi:hypothetical protein